MLFSSLIAPLLVLFAKDAYGFSRDALEPGATTIQFRDYDEAPISTGPEHTPVSSTDSAAAATQPQYPPIKNLQSYLEAWSMNYAQHRGSKYGPEVKSVSIAGDLSKFDRLERAIKAAANHINGGYFQSNTNIEEDEAIGNSQEQEHYSNGLERRSKIIAPVVNSTNTNDTATLKDSISDHHSNSGIRTPAIATMGIAVALAACVGMSL